MEPRLSRITASRERARSGEAVNSPENILGSSNRVENSQQAMTQLNFTDILENNNNVSPREFGQILRAIGDELMNSSFKYRTRSSQNG